VVVVAGHYCSNIVVINVIIGVISIIIIGLIARIADRKTG